MAENREQRTEIALGPLILSVESSDESVVRPGQPSAYFRVEFEEAAEAEEWFGVYRISCSSSGRSSM